MKRRSPWALVVLMVIGSLIVWESASGAANPAAERRYERTRSFSPAWNAQCDAHSCEVLTLIEVPVATPADVAEVDVIATLTLDYRTTPSDSGGLAASFRQGSGPRTQMNPGDFPVTSPDRFTSATIVWVKRNVPASGRDYTFEVSVGPRRGDDDPDVSVRGRRLSFVVDMAESAH